LSKIVSKAATSPDDVPVPVNKRTGAIPCELTNPGPQAVKPVEIRRREAAMEPLSSVREHSR
jgi:hypothetical protein